MKRALLILLWTLPLLAQSDVGELRLRVGDPTGSAVRGSVELVSDGSHFRREYSTDSSGELVARHLPLGLYRITVRGQDFVPWAGTVEIRSAIPVSKNVELSIAAVVTTVEVKGLDTLIDPEGTGTVNRIPSDAIEDRVHSQPGRSLIELVNSQPGWLLEADAVPHPRGSEYQTQFVVDGIPLTDKRAPGFAPEFDADEVESISVYTAGIPAEYGRKMGAVVEVAAARDPAKGWHGNFAASGGSFATAGGSGQLQFRGGKNTLGISGSGAQTDWYLNPPVTQNYTNTGTTSDVAARYERDFSSQDHLGLTVRHTQSRFLVPNEQVQEAAGQRQARGANETVGTVSYEHIFSANFLSDVRAMVRDDGDTLSSNLLSTPMIASQDRGFREGYFKATISGHRGNQDWKAGVEADFSSLHEAFRYVITDPTPFGPGTPLTFAFAGRNLNLEQAAFAQDVIRLGKWTLSAGLRWDHYQLLVNQNAVSPRLGISRYFAIAGLLLHASYDRIFQTPASENILLSSSPEVTALSSNVLRLPVEPSHGDYFEAGASKGFLGRLRLDVNGFRRNVNNFADDDLLFNTSISFPIAFRRAQIYGAEGKLDLLSWKRWNGYVSYSYMVGSAYLPVTGGLFLGDDATDALGQIHGRFWVSQDQRHTLRTRFQYHFVPRAFVALGASYGSGLPVEFTGTLADALAQYGPAIVDRVDFARGRVKPSYSVDGSLGAGIWKRDQVEVRVQGDVVNMTDHLNVINFAGLFSGNSVIPPRSYGIRLVTSF